MEKSLEKIISAKIKNVKNKTLTEDYIIKKRLKLLENYNLKKGVNKKNRIDDIHRGRISTINSSRRIG